MRKMAKGTSKKGAGSKYGDFMGPFYTKILDGEEGEKAVTGDS
jgi:hypothetical protein